MATTLEQRIDRLESIEAIRGIVSRYPLCLDARDIDGVVALFVEDVRAYPGAERGRGPLHEHYTNLCKGWGVTCHVNSGNAVFDFIDDDHAEGHLYCRAEHEIGEQWVIAMLRYHDRYERRDDGKWYFRWRRVHLFYVTDMLERPMGPDRVRWPGPRHERGRDAVHRRELAALLRRRRAGRGPRTLRAVGAATPVVSRGGCTRGGRGRALAGLADQPR